jgi:RHS repeat-associated protein
VTSEVQDLDGLTPNITYASAFNAASLMTQLTATIGSTADFKNTYAYDDLNRLTQLLQQGQSGGNAVAVKRVDFDYNAAGQYTQLRRYQDASATEHAGTTNYGYDDIGRLLKLTHHDQVTALASGTSWGTGILAGYQYTWDAASRITGINNYVDGAITYGYDNTNQLTSADNPSPLADESYSYDENGNRTMAGYTVGDNNQVTSDGTHNYAYDDEGNLLTKTTIATSAKEEYTWDYRNRLTKVTFKDGSNNVLKTVDYAYDVFDRLIRRTYDSDGPGAASPTDQFFSFMGDSIDPALQFEGASASDLSHRYLWGDLVDQLLADEKVTSLSSAGNILWPAWDHLNSTRDLIDRNESTSAVTILNHRTFDGFGQLTSESSPANSILFGFTGKLYDPITGNQLNWKRWVRTPLGRWLSEDPVGFAAGDANLTRYVHNIGIRFLDPLGLQ